MQGKGCELEFKNELRSEGEIDDFFPLHLSEVELNSVFNFTPLRHHLKLPFIRTFFVELC